MPITACPATLPWRFRQWKVNAGQTTFAKLMGQLPWYEFQKSVARYRGDTHGFNTV
jgi:hypothetical protein